MKKKIIFGFLKALKYVDYLFGFQNFRGHTFYGRALNAQSNILDLGAHRGAFSQLITSKYKCQAYAVEASPQYYAQIPDSPLIHKYHYAMAAHDGTEVFYESTNPESGNIVGPKSNASGKTVEVKTRTLASLIAEMKLGAIDLLKIDIEGAEIQLFDKMNTADLAGVKQITIEFHDSVPIPNVSEEDVNRVITKIMALGFKGRAMHYKNLDWFFWDEKKVRMSALSKLYLRLRGRKGSYP